MIRQSPFMARRQAESAEIRALAFAKLVGVARKHVTDATREETERIIASGSFIDLLDWCFWLQTESAA